MELSPKTLYPLRFDPIFQYRAWGGRRLTHWLTAPLPDGDIGEAWLLSDRPDHNSRVAEGPLQGQTLGHLMEMWPTEMLGKCAGRFRRFPLLLKFLDVRQRLSVQVHPNDSFPGECGKTEAWVVLEAGPESIVYAGLKPATSAHEVSLNAAQSSLVELLSSFQPLVGDGVFLPAGTIHSLGDAVVFEVQQNSDVTFRLYDWDRVDNQNGIPRALQVGEALTCLDFPQAAVFPVRPELKPVPREQLFDCDHFGVWRLRGDSPFSVGAAAAPRLLVCLEGELRVEHNDKDYALAKGDVMLLPASVGTCLCKPLGTFTLLEISLAEVREEAVFESGRILDSHGQSGRE